MKKIDGNFVAQCHVSQDCEKAVNMFLCTASTITSIEPAFSSTVGDGVIVRWSSEFGRLEVDVDRFGMFFLHSSVGADVMMSIHPSGFIGDLRDLAKSLG